MTNDEFADMGGISRKGPDLPFVICDLSFSA